MRLHPAIDRHYRSGVEKKRLFSSPQGILERIRTQDILSRYLPKPPAVVLDVGGGVGVYSLWLAGKGYRTHLIDPVDLHVKEALKNSRRQPRHPLESAMVGDARQLRWPDKSTDIVQLMGPLYHLVKPGERREALREAFRILRPGGVLVSAGISRYASILDGVLHNFLNNSRFMRIVEKDLRTGRHENPTHYPPWFTTSYFHLPDELKKEVHRAGFQKERLLAVEGPMWLLGDLKSRLMRASERKLLLRAIRRIECEASLLGCSAHFLVLARKPF